jgi:signal transduction histidine kinase
VGLLNKISIKLATYFIVTVLIMEGLLMVYLHQTIVHTRIEEEFSQLVSVGSHHRGVLEDNYSEDKIRQILLMESGSKSQAIITDLEYNLIINTENNDTPINSLLSGLSGQTFNKDQILQSNWEDEDFISSIHPFEVNGVLAGYLIMFQSTETVQLLISNLDFHFILAGLSSLISVSVVYFILSKLLTRPLIRMKEATEKLSNGEYNVKLPPKSNDELGELSMSIEKLASDLEKIKKDRIEFLASISHELRTPLTYLAGYSKVAMRSELNEEERKKYLSIIDDESKRMTKLVGNLFDLAKMDETSFTVFKQSFQAVPFFKNLHERMLPSFNLKNIQLKLRCNENFEVHADSLRLEQIVMNLLDNALKYSQGATTTVLEVSRINEKTVISVIDQGLGIDEKNYEDIFEKLFRVEKSRSREYGGTGLGLSIVKELVEAHDGVIVVESEVGKGSKFTVTI